ncbi:hypothetical protein COCSUDRAFT_66290 [Coccomyxa subellipsoidea C-169]|uniref:DUF7755 domain-containing protein n=1 Tax=Coccomyxa subellipsoidea (strain C-169) TaxID=574566 RepID=I0YW10_COCSC|nr:hypothetical protein COCSUDRAFT_66290 [Coccomyxa subellipsoidea C-169]EIE22579.1 hypothetical protein COCSUDRAFT_66290 [Coccomyxa subellipsoidea C-169]|eukprot:XP_005647123.1 hypothetical protein COCSUDRAFT_66290 [Coccomyxa subellipsoidea C-169]
MKAAGAASQKDHTVYTLRFSTGFGRGCGLDVPGAGVQVCLIGEDGQALLHRISPLNDPLAAEQDALAICKVVDKEAGADCKRVLKAASTSRARSAALKQRFQGGAVDEVSFLGPELGPIASLMVAPEEGSWRVDEVTVCSSRTRHTDRFVCREALGYGGVPAGFLAPVPADSVVYGSGESAVILSREQAAMLHAAGMLDYSSLKDRILVTTAALVAAGSSLCYSMGGWPATEPFLAGGAVGLAYQSMLQANVDSLPGSGAYSTRVILPGPAQTLQRIMGSSTVRLMAVAGLSLGAVWGLKASSGGSSDDVLALQQILEVRQVLTGLMGFMMYKLALVGCSAVPTPPHQHATEEERLI